MVTTVNRPKATPESVKHALEAIDRPTALVLSPLARLPIIAEATASAELRGLLIDVIAELSDSRSYRDAQSGHLLFDYYVKRTGAHDLIMQRLHLSRPTYFRRLSHGYAQVALHINRLSDFALWFQL